MTAAVPGAVPVETPSGKDAEYENFPVGSFLLPAHARPHVAVFYRFARAIDDIADNPTLTAGEKIRRLDGFAASLEGTGGDGYETGRAMGRSLAETHIAPDHCLDLIAAFKQDAVKNRYDHWDDLMAYCLKSAAPVGRYLLDLHGGSRNGYGPSDALCNALQVINHLQDCQEDYEVMDRVYLPLDWMAEAGADPSDLKAHRASPALRQVIDRCLDGTRELLRQAAALPGGLHSRRLAMESGAILDIAHVLTQRLARQDPVAGRVALSKPGTLVCCLRGALQGLVA
ncbi:squalene synthase HpnC [Magnetospira sp. QH-2]|uniref:squalene synthase HpnC n=1 Tax=Magnetospira sp. (strain QH-2) TaxID=1288970 RepID=UPI0003E8110F|nr:squalene synthase HpnC [Magnetospira sp. QH-2]CCQ73406.1 putative phytoene synthase [Magnetospira sp. QH-2]